MTKAFKARGAALLVLSLIVAIACNDSEADPSASSISPDVPSPAYDWSKEPWPVVVTLPVFSDFVREMGGNQVEVHSLIPPGQDPHTYVPDHAAADLVKDADIVLVNGLGLDQPAIDFIEANRPDGRLFMVDFAGNIPSPTTPQPIGGKPIFATDVGDNPHLYLDPLLAPIYAETVSHSLVIIDEINEPYYDALFAAYTERLRDLHERIQSDMASIPEERRSMIIEHDSMVHWATRYGLQINGTLEGDGEDRLSQILATQPPPGVFTETGMGDGSLEDLANEFAVTPCEISTDSIADPDTAFIEMMENNSTVVRSCLGG